jgi:hypothetical protein
MLKRQQEGLLPRLGALTLWSSGANNISGNANCSSKKASGYSRRRTSLDRA